MTDQQSHALPEDPALAEVAASLQGAGHWGWVVDPQWRILFVTDELRLTFGGNVELADWPVGVHMFSPEFLAATRAVPLRDHERRALPQQLRRGRRLGPHRHAGRA